MIFDLKYGTKSIKISVPEDTVIPSFTEPEFDIEKPKFQNGLSETLPKNIASLETIAIIVSDKTRLCGYPEYLPWLTELLINSGVSKEKICFYIAYGTHARQTEEESFKSYGETYKEFKFIHHNCSDNSVFAQKGITKRSTPVNVRKDVLSSSLIITFGSISHHYFAGYGGGRKLLFPGLASKDAIYHNHGLFLDYSSRSLSAGCQPGNLKDNPLADDLKEIDSFMPAKISIHGILNSSGKVCKLLIGKNYDDFVSACKMHDNYYRCGITSQFDFVIASGGGYPKDINFIQTHKSVHHSAAFVKDGGTLLLLSQCIDKIGSDYFMKYLEAGSYESAFDMLEKHYEGNGGTALSMMQKTKRINIYMFTSLDKKICKTIGVTKINENDIQRMIDERKGKMAVIANASMLIK